MDSIKTMPYWSDEDYSYPLPDVSHLSRKKALKLRAKGIDFVTFGFRDRIKSDEEFEACITLVAQWNNQCNIDEEYYEEGVKEDVELYRYWWYHGRHLQALRKKMPPFIKKLVKEARNGPMFFGRSLYRLELEKFRCMRAYFSYSFVADEEGDFSFKPWMDICIRLLEYIVAEGRGISDEQSLHLNVRNVRDIVEGNLIEYYNQAPLPSEAGESVLDKAYCGRQIYVRKAERLYYQIRLNKIRDWWEP